MAQIRPLLKQLGGQGLQPLIEMPHEDLGIIDYVLTDIDDTLTLSGRLPAVAYQAMEELFDAGYVVVPVTGRPAGWCDMIARFWPVQGVIGENGAFYFAYDPETKSMKRRYAKTNLERQHDKDRLESLAQAIVAKVPGSMVASDQAYREADLAIDFCEDVPSLDDQQIALIKTLMEEAGLTAKISSIHVNGWFGGYDKLSMAEIFFKEVLNLNLAGVRSKVIYCGDSPNDAPMFRYFPQSCGVANVLDFQGSLEAEPRWVTEKRGGHGFAQVASRLLAVRHQA